MAKIIKISDIKYNAVFSPNDNDSHITHISADGEHTLCGKVIDEKWLLTIAHSTPKEMLAACNCRKCLAAMV